MLLAKAGFVCRSLRSGGGPAAPGHAAAAAESVMADRANPYGYWFWRSRGNRDLCPFPYLYDGQVRPRFPVRFG